MATTIRQLGPADTAAYRRVRHDALANHPEVFGEPVESFDARGDDEIAASLERLAFFGAFEAEQLCGLALFVASEGSRERHRGAIYQVYVAPHLRGTGCGRALIEAVLRHAEGRVLQVHLTVTTENAPALRLYREAGFEICGTDPRALYVNGRYIDEHLMVRFFDKAPGDQK